MKHALLWFVWAAFLCLLAYGTGRASRCHAFNLKEFYCSPYSGRDNVGIGDLTVYFAEEGQRVYKNILSYL